jgi:cytochrome c biogenesis protein CcmG/thiol:disulfide interchange protein DsbE
MPKLIKLAFIGFFIFVLYIFYVGLNKKTEYNTKGIIGNKISNVNLQNFNGINFFNEEIFEKNNFTLVNVWASWCGPCRIEHPILMKLEKETNLNLVGINYKDKKEKAEFFLKSFGNPYDILTIDKVGKQSVNFGVYGVPESILINKDMLILKKYLGPLTMESYKEIKNIIN